MPDQADVCLVPLKALEDDDDGQRDKVGDYQVTSLVTQILP
jgi:hypothetical protein